MSIKVKILKSSSSKYWYSNRIGEIFEIKNLDGYEADPSKYDAGSGCIDKVDCQIVELSGFKLGDEIKPTSSGHGFGRSDLDRIYIIEDFGIYTGAIKSEQHGARVKFKSSGKRFSNSNYDDFIGLSRVKKVQPPQFDVGDWVQLIAKHDRLSSGSKGKIIKVTPSGYHLDILDKPIPEDKLIKCEKMKVVDCPFKVGDEVYIKDSSEYKSQGMVGDRKKVGKIKKIRGNGMLPHDITIIWDDGNSNVYSHCDIEPILKQTTTESKDKFIVGKWYKGFKDKDKLYIKFSRSSSGRYLHFTEYIRATSGHQVFNGDWELEGHIVEASMEEIQDYLPAGHPEKVEIKKEITSLPEKWCVKDCQEVSNWAAMKFKCGSRVSPNYFHLHHSLLDGYGFIPYIRPDFIEITLEQFNKWVVKDEPKTLPQTLPEKWCVRVDSGWEDYPELYQWRGSRWYTQGYISYDRDWSGNINFGCTEITMGQFMEWVIRKSETHVSLNVPVSGVDVTISSIEPWGVDYYMDMVYNSKDIRPTSKTNTGKQVLDIQTPITINTKKVNRKMKVI